MDTTAKNKYHNSKIYKLISYADLTKEIWIGATTMEKLCMRLAKYRSDFKQGKITNETLIDLFEAGLVHIILIEEFLCENKDQLSRRLDWWKNKMNLADKTKQHVELQILSNQLKLPYLEPKYENLDVSMIDTSPS